MHIDLDSRVVLQQGASRRLRRWARCHERGSLPFGHEFLAFVAAFVIAVVGLYPVYVSTPWTYNVLLVGAIILIVANIIERWMKLYAKARLDRACRAGKAVIVPAAILDAFFIYFEESETAGANEWLEGVGFTRLWAIAGDWRRLMVKMLPTDTYNGSIGRLINELAGDYSAWRMAQAAPPPHNA